MTNELLLIADELRALANAGLRYANNVYDRNRYERTLELSARLAATLEQRDVNEVLGEYRGNYAHVSPVVGADAAVTRQGVNGEHELLLMQRADNGLWAMPGGLVEVGETVAAAAERELAEETGLRGRTTRLLGIFDSRRVGTRSPVQLYHVVVLVAPLGDLPAGGGSTPGEVTDVAWFTREALPPLHHGHTVMVPKVFELLNAATPTTYLDPA